MWSRTKRELFYQTLDQHIMVASYSVEGDSFRADRPRMWSSTRFVQRPALRSINIHPDGERFVVAANEEGPEAKQDKVVFIFNFFDELRRLAPPTAR
jgi:hypothetical protein